MNLEACDAEFENIASSRDSHAIRRSFQRLLEDHPDVNLGFGRGSIYWRARLSDQCGFACESEVGYPPPNLARAGRLNDAGVPCLYLSAKRETALAEIGAKAGDYVHLMGHRVLADQVLRTIAIGELAHVQKTGYVRITGVDPKLTIARMLNRYPLEQGLRIAYIDSYLASVLSDPDARESAYVRTQILAKLLYGRSQAVGMFYPSVRSPLGINLAVSAQAADCLFHSAVSVVVHVKRALRFGYFDFDVVRTARDVSEAGRFAWQTPEYPQHMHVFHLSKEEHEKLARNQSSILDLLAC
jgi:hypothetical protein